MSYLDGVGLTSWTATCGCTDESMCVQCEIKHQKRQKERKENLLDWVSLLQGMSIPIFLFGFGLIGVVDLIGAQYPLFFMVSSIVIGIAGTLFGLWIERKM